MIKTESKRKILASPIGRSANASRRIPAIKAGKKIKESRVTIVIQRRQIKTSGSAVTVPSRRTEMRSNNKSTRIIVNLRLFEMGNGTFLILNF